jgi:ubiquinone/menaquinone biosynthesis C-methylase UbiE
MDKSFIEDDNKNIKLYDSLLKNHNLCYQSLNWGSKESQEKRFQVLTEIGIKQGDTVLDVGCGLADYYSWLTLNFGTVGYQGIDITPSMVEACKKKYPRIDFSIGTVFNVPVEPSSIDYVVASGIFYLRKENPQYYLEKTIAKMFSIAKKGIAFNSLSTWTQKQELSEFYADPLLVVKFCQSLSNKVVLRHDYHPGDFTIYLYH